MSTENIRKTMDIVNEGPTTNRKGEVIENNVQVNIQTLAKDARIKGRYDFNKGFLTFQDIINDPNSFLSKYRRDSQKDTTSLIKQLAGLKKDPRYTDKEKYLRQGWEARGYSNGSLILIWYKEKGESLMIFARSNDALMEVRDFLKFFGVIA